MMTLTEKEKGLLEKVAEKAYALLATSEAKSHDWEHTLRVRNIALQIAKELNSEQRAPQVNLFVLEAAALLHDIARPKEMQSSGEINHAKLGSEMALDILLDDLKVETYIADAICHCIENHRSKGGGNNKSWEANILFDADKLDALGAVGILRLDRFAYEVGAGLHNKTADLKNVKAYTAEDTAFREFYTNTRYLRDKMCTRQGKKLATEMHRFMVLFFEQFFKEINADEVFFKMLEECK